MGRNSDARQKLLDAAGELMRGQGYGAMSVAGICELAGVRKGSFYHFFDSKQVLAVEALRAAWAAEEALWKEILRSSGRPLHRLERLLLAQADAQHRGKRESGFVRGSLFANLALELGAQDETVRECLEEIFDQQVSLVHGALLEAAELGHIPKGEGTHATRRDAQAVLAQLEGTVLFAKLHNDPSVLDGLWSQVAGLLRTV
ncbi:TetR/AcrR family transcriptional regulator [Saccharothrix algeriensis]|nr:TetR/AcrR family transcriptional regulator [Saccharothrix algeriensis]